MAVLGIAVVASIAMAIGLALFLKRRDQTATQVIRNMFVPQVGRLNSAMGAGPTKTINGALSENTQFIIIFAEAP